MQPDEDGIALDACVVALSHTVGDIEVNILGFARYLVLGVEMQQDTMRATAGIGGDAQAVKCNFDACIFEAGVGRDVTDRMNGLGITARGGGSKVAEGVSGVLPGFVLKRPPALAAPYIECFGLGILGHFEHIGGLVLAYFTQFGGSLFWWQFAEHGLVVEPVGCGHILCFLA